MALRYPVLGSCFLLYVLMFITLGFIVDLLAQGLYGVEESRVWFMTGIFAIAWIAGFVTPGAPAGLGVREAVLVMGLTPIYGSGMAVGLSVTLRIVTTLGDGLAFVAALLGRKVLSQQRFK